MDKHVSLGRKNKAEMIFVLFGSHTLLMVTAKSILPKFPVTRTTVASLFLKFGCFFHRNSIF